MQRTARRQERHLFSRSENKLISNRGLEVLRGGYGGATDVSAGLAGESWPRVRRERFSFPAARPGSKGSPRCGKPAQGERQGAIRLQESGSPKPSVASQTQPGRAANQ